MVTQPIEAPVAPRDRDPHRPIYHFLPLSNWLNDPNGLIKWRGQYHMFFQYNPNGPFHGTIHWGHAVSDDLVHWRYLPIALAPTPGSPDADGCWSGCALDHNGVPTLIYTGMRLEPRGDGEQQKVQRPCLATSDNDMLTWTKYADNPIIAGPPDGMDVMGFRDHCVWCEGDTWYQIIGSGIRNVGGTVLLYRSTDLITWEYMHPLCVGDAQQTEPIYTGTMWECPQLLFFGDERAALIFSVFNRGTLFTAYMVGRYHNHRFTPEHTRKLDYGDRHFYAPQALIEPESGRILLWGWCQEARHREGQLEAGWSGAMSIPRVITLSDDGYLIQTPAPELAALRSKHTSIAPTTIAPGAENPLAAMHGDSIELSIAFGHKDDAAYGIVVRRAPDGSEATIIGYDPHTHELFIDRSRSSVDETTERHIQRGPLALRANEPLHLRVFVDRSIIEVFANDRAYLTSRMYPTRLDSHGLATYSAAGSIELTHGDLWHLDAARLHE